MSEVRKIDWPALKPVVIGVGSFALAMSIALMVDMTRQNSDLRRDLSELRIRFDQSQQNLALLQRLPASAPVAVQPAAAPAPQSQAPAAPVKKEPVEAEPARASATSLTFNMLMPGDEARPPLPVKAPIDDVPKSAKRDQPVQKQGEPRGNGNGPAAAQQGETSGERPRSRFVLLDKSAVEQPRQSNFKLIGQ